LLSIENVMRVVFAIGDDKVAVTRAETILGRGPDADVALEDKSVSRSHAAVVMTPSGPILRDLGSRNGTWVNGMRVGSDRRIRVGDRIRLGCATVRVDEISGDVLDRDDGWLAVQAAMLLKESTAGRVPDADEILFRIAEAIETRMSLGEAFGEEVCDAALAAVIDYATTRKRPGWTRWALGVHQKLGTQPGEAMRRSIENAGAEELLRSSGTVAVAAKTTTIKGRRAG
jgi:hypothetical protein